MWHWRHKSSPTRNNDRSIDRTSLLYHFICVRRSTIDDERVQALDRVRGRACEREGTSELQCDALSCTWIIYSYDAANKSALERTQSLAHECEYASQSRQRAPLCAAANVGSDSDSNDWRVARVSLFVNTQLQQQQQQKYQQQQQSQEEQRQQQPINVTPHWWAAL